MWRLQTMILLGGLTVAGQVKVDLGNQARNYDFSGAPFTRTVKTGTTLPAACNPGDLFYNTAAAAGTNLYGCTTLNVWSQETGVGASVTFTSSDGSITRAVAGANVDLAVDPAVVATATGNVDLSGANKLGLGATGFLSLTVPNEGTTGTTLNRLAMFTGAPSSLAVVAGAASSTGVIGVVVSGAGTTGNARIAFRGFAACDFDGATTAGDYVQTSTTTAGQCHDAAATRPASGQVLGYVTSSNAVAGAYTVLLAPDVVAAGGTVERQTQWVGTCLSNNLTLSGWWYDSNTYPSRCVLDTAFGGSGSNQTLLGHVTLVNTSTGFGYTHFTLPNNWLPSQPGKLTLYLSEINHDGNNYGVIVDTACIAGSNTYLTVAWNADQSTTLASSMTTDGTRLDVTLNPLTASGCSPGNVLLVRVKRDQSVTPNSSGWLLVVGATLEYSRSL